MVLVSNIWTPAVPGVIALVDRERKFIARIPPSPVGSPASESFQTAIERAPEAATWC